MSVRPDVLLGPRSFLTAPVFAGKTSEPVPFIKNRGCALLVRKGNAKKITGVVDLLRDDVRLFISNPDNEKVSHLAYKNALLSLLQAQDLDYDALVQRIAQGNTGGGKNNIVFGFVFLLAILVKIFIN